VTVSADVLKSALRPLFSPSGMPKSALEALDLWAKAYASYAQSAIAGGTFPAPLVPSAVSGPFFDALDQALRVMWMATAWAGPGLGGTTAVVPPLSLVLIAVGAGQLRNRDPEKALSAIVDALHTYTLGITVTVVTAAGAASVAPIT
jgi:hypothetical protein